MFSADPEFEVVRQAADGLEAVRLVEQLHPDVVLMDLRMPRMDGLSAIAALARSRSSAPVIVLTTYDSDADVLPALDAGAAGYLLKDAARDVLLRAVRSAARGETVLAPAVSARLIASRRVAKTALTARDIEVLTLVADGNTNQQRQQACSSARPPSRATC